MRSKHRTGSVSWEQPCTAGHASAAGESQLARPVDGARLSGCRGVACMQRWSCTLCLGAGSALCASLRVASPY
eukprot:10210663-Alexandrium_andersonii.AAC.1